MLKKVDLLKIKDFIFNHRKIAQRYQLDSCLEEISNVVPVVNVKDRILKRSKDIVRIRRSVINDLQNIHRLFAETNGFYTYILGSDNIIAITFLLGQKGNDISKVVLLKSYGGCAYMPNINSSDLNEASYELIKEGYFPAGIARLGFTEKVSTNHNVVSFGEGLFDILDSTTEQGMAFISLTRYNFNVQMPNKNRDDYVNASFKITGERRKKLCQAQKSK